MLLFGKIVRDYVIPLTYPTCRDRIFVKKQRRHDDEPFGNRYEQFRAATLELWNKHCEGKEILALKYSDFKLFFTSGNRKVYEETYFTRRLALDSAAILSLVYPEEEKYFLRLMDEIYAICDEYTWCLPAHQGQIEKNDNCHIDLFAAETGYALAEIYTLLCDRLDPLIKSRIETEIERRIFSSYEGTAPYGHWETCTNNWNAVCTGSVACTYMLMSPSRAEKLFSRFERSMEIYLSGLGDDGICGEGCGYWKYGFGFFTVYADMAKTFTKGAVNHFDDPKVKTVATYLQKMFLTDDVAVNFADSGRTLNYQLALQHYLKSVYPEDVLVYPAKYSYIHDHCGRFCLGIRSAVWFSEEYYLHPDSTDAPFEFFAEKSEWFVKKTHSYGLAAKGGNNREHHNHNDVGSFIYAKGGRQILADPGSGIYTRQYFKDESRYTEVFEPSSAAHNVPIVDGAFQKNGSKYRARNTRVENSVFITEIAEAYGNDRLASLERRIACGDEGITLTDRFECEDGCELVERFITFIKPAVEKGRIILEDGIIEIRTPCDISVKKQTVRVAETAYLIDMRLPAGLKTFACSIK